MSKPRVVVCAANRYGKIILLGARHWDTQMREQANRLPVSTIDLLRPTYGEVQGFIDQFGVFMDRREAWQVAQAAGQIKYRCGGDDKDGGTLYSENLY